MTSHLLPLFSSPFFLTSLFPLFSLPLFLTSLSLYPYLTPASAPHSKTKHCFSSWQSALSLPVGFISSRNSSRRLSGGMPPAMTFTLETDGGVIRPGVDRDMTLSNRGVVVKHLHALHKVNQIREHSTKKPNFF